MENSNIKLCDDSLCTHCGACINICSRNAISFSKPNDLGDIHPSIDSNKCINCGLCFNVCPQLSRDLHFRSISKPLYYAGWSKRFRKKGSSGGVFGELACYVLSNGGIVCGAAYNQQGILVHKMIDSINDLELLVGAKYVTSDTGLIYIQILEELKKDKLVLFCGTPCQVVALYSVLPEKYISNLLTIDLVCWGAPSQILYQAYMKKIMKIRKKTFTGYSFRVLRSSRPDVHVHTSHKKYILKKSEQTYNEAFGRYWAMKQSCYICRYKSINRLSDITLGDYHTIGKEKPFINKSISKGVSLIMLNTEKGKKIMEDCKLNFQLYKKNTEQVLNTNISIREAQPKPKERDLFCKLMMDENVPLREINNIFNFNGLKLSAFRTSFLGVIILDLIKDIKQYLKI